MAPFQQRARKIYEQEADLYNYAISALSRKMRTVAEMKRLMRSHTTKGEPGELLIEAVIARLKEQKYLNDADYTERYALSRQQTRKYGKRRVEIDLMNKGVHGDVIHQIVESVYQDTSEPEQIRAFLARKHIQKPQTQKETARVFHALQRVGFAPNAIFAVFHHWPEDPTSES